MEDNASATERLIEIARKDIGVREEACENCGKRIKIYLDYLGIRQAAPWCAAAVSYWFHLAGFSGPKTAWSPAMFPKERIVLIDFSLSQRQLRTGHFGKSAQARPKVDLGQVSLVGRSSKDSPVRDKGKLSGADAKGLVLGIYFPSLKRIGHVGLVEGLKGDFVCSIEANTNVRAEREGEGVYRRMRHRRTIYCYSDWVSGNKKGK